MIAQQKFSESRQIKDQIDMDDDSDDFDAELSKQERLVLRSLTILNLGDLAD